MDYWFTATWMNPKCILLSGWRHIPKAKYCMIPLIRHSEKNEAILVLGHKPQTKKQQISLLGVRVEKGIDNEGVAWGSFLGNQTVLCGDVLMDTWFYAIVKTHRNFTPQRVKFTVLKFKIINQDGGKLKM